MVEPSPRPSQQAPASGVDTALEDSIAAVLMEGRRILPSRRVETKESPDLPLVAEAHAAGNELAQTIEGTRAVYKQLKSQPVSGQIDSGADFCISLGRGLSRLMASIEAQPPPGPERHRSVGELLLPFALTHWREFPPQDNGSLILEMHQRDQAPETDGASAVSWVKQVTPYINIVQTGTDLPGFEEFIAASRSMGPQLAELRKEISEHEKKLTQARSKLEKAADDADHEAASALVSRCSSELDRAQQRIPQLFERCTDVKVSNVPQVFSSLSIRLTPRDEFSRALCQAVGQLERVIYGATFAALDKRIESTLSFTIPLPAPEGKISTQKVSIAPEDLKALGKSPARLARVIEAYKSLRDALHSVHRLAGEYTDLATTEGEKIRTALQEPLGHLKEARTALNTLIRHEDPRVGAAAVRLFETPIFETNQATHSRPFLVDARAFPLLSSITARYLGSAPTAAAEFQQVFQSQSSLQETFGIITQARSYLERKDTDGLATFLNDQLIVQEQTYDYPRALGILAVLHSVTGNAELVREMRFQISHLPVTKELAKKMIAEQPAAKDLLLDSVHDIVCTLSQSLRDYYAADKDGRLQEAVSIYRFYLRNPQILSGIPANHALKNSVAVYGPPGVGKSFFAQCLANELDDISLVVLSPGDKEPDQDQLAYIKGVFDRVKEQKSPVLLLIDEAETTVFSRMHPLALSVDRERTNYILQEVDSLRKDYPNVFILIASNYPDRVDEAMERHGRVDLVVYLGNPGPQERESILRDTLRKEGVQLGLSVDEIAQLVALSEEFIPIQIIQAITETQRLYIPYMRSIGKELEWSFALLKSRFELMRKEDLVRKEKRTVMPGPKNQAEGVSQDP